jgi:hypothetical protein
MSEFANSAKEGRCRHRLEQSEGISQSDTFMPYAKEEIDEADVPFHPLLEDVHNIPRAIHAFLLCIDSCDCRYGT